MLGRTRRNCLPNCEHSTLASGGGGGEPKKEAAAMEPANVRLSHWHEWLTRASKDTGLDGGVRSGLL